MADDREVEPDIRVDCDLLILDYIVHDALGTLLAQAEDWLRDANNRKHHDALENIANKLRMVDCSSLFLTSRRCIANLPQRS